MDFPKDGGLSCVRHYLDERGDAPERIVWTRLTSPGAVVGRFVCQCSAEAWHVTPAPDHAWLACDCNGSTIPVYLGPPPVSGRPWLDHDCRQLGCRRGAVVIGIGYPGPVPEQGRVDVERALEVVVAVVDGEDAHVVWEVHLEQPPTIRGDEPWIRRIPGLR